MLCGRKCLVNHCDLIKRYLGTWVATMIYIYIYNINKQLESKRIIIMHIKTSLIGFEKLIIIGHLFYSRVLPHTYPTCGH